ncbi:MAG: hypothetical protein CMP38_01395 [Rickettsiales bacterium]|nr:hypothetical protein [Rickettsiales bacterium]OUW05434.1 MAG: hypothetical protein CBD16_01015 [Betaproteobacteria bacterium TMED156]
MKLGFLVNKLLFIKFSSVFFLFSPMGLYSLTVSEELSSASQLLSKGDIESLVKAENASRLATLEEPRASLAHWLRAQSIFGLAGIEFGFDEKDKPFIEEARVRSIPIPSNLVPENILVFPNSKNEIDYFLLMETNSSRLYIYKLNKSGDFKFEISFYSSIGLSGDNKIREGDKKTPIGVYRFVKEIVNPRADGFLGDLAMTLDYPNAKDKQDGRTGYGIWIHGVPKDTFVRSPKASDGCLALSNDDIQILKNYITYRKTHILIVSDVSWVAPEDWKNKSRIVEDLLSKSNISKNETDSELLAYFRVARDRPSVALRNKKGIFSRDYWNETEDGLRKILTERLN